MTAVMRFARLLAIVTLATLAGAACGESSPEVDDSRGTTTTSAPEDPDTTAEPPTSSSTATSSSTTTTIDPALGFAPVPFRAASLGDDADRLREILDASGITVNPYFDSCTAIEFTGWDPDRGDIDVFVLHSGTSPCPGDSLSRFYAIRNRAVVVEAAVCGDCEPGTLPDEDRYLAIRRALEGKPAIHGTIGGGARWGFDAFEEIVLGAPSGSTSDTPTTVAASDYAMADWGGAMAPIDGAAFSSPSGNVVCILWDTSATCGITEHDWSLPERDCGEISFIEEYVRLSSDGVEKGVCAGGIEAPYAATTLPYGSTLAYGGIECTAEETGVTCTHRASRRGFTVSRSTLESF